MILILPADKLIFFTLRRIKASSRRGQGDFAFSSYLKKLARVKCLTIMLQEKRFILSHFSKLGHSSLP
jgi:hypothetical protein